MSAKDKKVPRNRAMMYAQQPQYAPYKDVDSLYDAIETKLKPKRFAVILHDKDVDDKGQPEAPQLHAMLEFENARHVRAVAKALGDKPQYLQIWDAGISNGFSYLVHRTEKAKNKYQYNPDEVKANFDYAAELERIAKQVNKAKSGKKGGKVDTLLNELYSGSIRKKDVEEQITGSEYGKNCRKIEDVEAKRLQQEAKVDTLLNELYSGSIRKKDVEEQITGSEYGKNCRKIEDVEAKRLQQEAEEFNRKRIEAGKPVVVIWIWGYSGTGKTSLAIDKAKQAGTPYYITGSTRDIFQRYKGEHTIIFDEFRPKSMEYEDLLRIIDPYSVAPPYYITGSTRDIFQRYKGEHTIIFDEFRPKSMEYEDLLRIIDPYSVAPMAPARYHDKYLACDLFIFTSPYSPSGYYNEKFPTWWEENSVDSFEQLHRRISLALYLDEDYIYLAKYNTHTKEYEKDENIKVKNTYSKSARNHSGIQKSDEDTFRELFD